LLTAWQLLIPICLPKTFFYFNIFIFKNHYRHKSDIYISRIFKIQFDEEQ